MTFFFIKSCISENLKIDQANQKFSNVYYSNIRNMSNERTTVLFQFFKCSQIEAEQTTFNQIILPQGFVFGPILDQMANGFKANLRFYSKRLELCPFPPIL